MELSSPNPDLDDSLQVSRRKSGRVVKEPARLDYDASGDTVTGKRKRFAAADDDDDASSSSEQESDDEPDEEELREQRRRVRRNKAAAPAISKVNGVLPHRGKAAKRQRQTSRVALAEDAPGLYGDVFGQRKNLVEAAAQWKATYDKNPSMALAELVNLILRTTGSQESIDVFDIDDPDNAPNRIKDLQDQLETQGQTDYPIVSRAKGTASLKKTLVLFFDTLAQTLSSTGLLVTRSEVIENILVWVGAMTSSAQRPFRHTATVVALGIMNGLCEAGKLITTTLAKLQRQGEGEEKKAKVNRGRLQSFRETEKAEDEKRVVIENVLKDFTDAIFVHRYRDVDPHIRVECVAHLSNWVMTYPEHFFSGNHIRYLGWLLSDVSPATRQEVVKNLQVFYRDSSKVGGLQQFTERFRPRIIEMATQDADPSIRASAVELLDSIRDAGLLEPSDIDTIGRLVFDAEPRVRKAVVPFFAASVADSYADKVDELGGEEALEEGLPASEDYDTIRIEWLKLKALAELLTSFDPHEQPLQAGGAEDSRFALAAQAYLPSIDELSDWQILAGYLLYDSTASNSRDVSLEAQFKRQATLNENEEAFLLQILDEAVGQSLADIANEGKDRAKTPKKERDALQQRQETIAQQLATLIPRLLNKFGASPSAASAVLRLERLLNLEVFQELRQDSTYAELLDNIQKQFNTHEKEHVVAEATNALLHARSFSGLSEITEERLRNIWTETAYALVGHSLGEDLQHRGSIDTSALTSLAGSVLRLSSLGRVSDSIETLDTPVTYAAGQRRRQTKSAPVVPLTVLLELLERGKPTSGLDAELSGIEDDLVLHAISAVLCYFLWQAQRIQNASIHAQVRGPKLASLLEKKDSFTSRLVEIINSRPGADKVRIAAGEALLDLYTVFTIDDKPKDISTVPEVLKKPLSSRQQTALLHLFVAAERDFAQKSRKKLEEAQDDDEPEEEPESDSDDEDEEPGPPPAGLDEPSQAAWSQQQSQHREAARLRLALVAEDALCGLTAKIVIGIIAGVVDAADDSGSGSIGLVERRIGRNKGRLGSNYREVLAALDAKPGAGKHASRKGKGKAKVATSAAAGPRAGGAKAYKSAEIVEDDDDDDGEDGDEPPEEEPADDEDIVEMAVDVDASPASSVAGD